MRILPSCREEETFTTRGKSTIRSVSREEGYAFAIKTATRQRITLRSDFPCGRERERERSIKVRRKGLRSFVKTGDVDDLKIER